MAGQKRPKILLKKCSIKGTDGYITTVQLIKTEYTVGGGVKESNAFLKEKQIKRCHMLKAIYYSSN